MSGTLNSVQLVLGETGNIAPPPGSVCSIYACTATTCSFKNTSPSPAIHVARLAGETGVEINVASSLALRSRSTLQGNALPPPRTVTTVPGRIVLSVASEGRSGPASSK